MKTTLDSRPGSPELTVRHRRAAATAWPMISAADRLRVSPCWPVAQNGQAMPQPAWLEMQTVARPG